ncbi:rhodanese-like domain-containing protein [Metapseudomonas resinovorans]|uniref:Rhodanese domain-containing protein n=1 Tax=Metapseudomonas resinovorans NBRC 106553 TaxID=1245471 RepID=S6AGZ6_METRE|nr:rhodanese-like domain-containing protein [Pseudomonas resinovorans]BAN49702.1 hypothetical protein PCA10_39700 [Pseudomonas resinovorans NBRC 106553]
MRLLPLLFFCLVPLLHAQEAPLEVKGAMTVNVLQARYLYERGAIFIDVRPTREWTWGHIHGALHLELLDRFQDLEQPHWPRQIPLVIYCDSDVCPHGAQAVRMAVGWGYRQVFYFREGYFAWQLQDFPQGKGLQGERLVLNLPDR